MLKAAFLVPVYTFRLLTPRPSTKTRTPETKAPFVSKATNGENLEDSASKGLKLLDDLVATISEASGTEADSDLEEVEAAKSIFPDVIDEVITLVETKFGANSGNAEKNALISNSNETKLAISNASTQSDIVSILNSYIASLKEFTSRGVEDALV